MRFKRCAHCKKIRKIRGLTTAGGIIPGFHSYNGEWVCRFCVTDYIRLL